MPLRAWGVLGGLIITTISSADQLDAAQEPIVRVLVLDAKQLRFRADGDKPLLVLGIGPNKKRMSTLKIREKNGQFKMAMNGSPGRWSSLPINTQLRIMSTDPRGIWLGKRRYRGELRVLIRANRLKVVNHLEIEKYLVSVVGSEMPKSWPMAALKAQAVAARTYALQQLGKKDFHDINSTEASQVYLGIEAETKRTKNAVESTRSLVMTYRGRLINAVFHSSSGGATEASGAVWRRQLPYLVSVPDHDQHNPYYDWKVKFNSTQLRVAFPEIGGVQSIEVLRISPTKRVLLARIYGRRGDLELTGKDLRSRLGLKSTLAKFEMTSDKSSSNKQSAKSSPSVAIQTLKPLKNENSPNYDRINWYLGGRDSDSFTQSLTSPPPLPPPLPLLNSVPIPPSLPPLPKKNTLLVQGSGSGHGVGMSQWGAHGLAEKGVDFRRILIHYYKGVEIRKFSST